MKYFSISEEGEYKLLVKGSRFIAGSFPVKSREDAEARLTRVRKKFYDATHNCFAWRLGGKNSGEFRYSDDGEPSGTAGKPIFDVLEKYEVYDILVIVTRYFGGTKLGTGGLVRAYSDAADGVLGSFGKVLIEQGDLLQFEFPYDLKGIVERELKRFPVIRKELEFSESIKLTIEVHEEGTEELIQDLRDVSQGKIIGNRLEMQ